MTETTLFLALVAVATLVFVSVIALPDPRRGALVGEAETLVRFSATAAIGVLSTALLYLAEELTGSVVALAVGDGMMVLTGWMMWSALSAVNGRALVVPFLAVVAAAASTVVSLVIPETPATSVKLVIVAIGCLGIGVESLLGRLGASPVRGVFTGVGFGFGGYTLARVGVITFLGERSTAYERAFTTAASTVVSALAIVATTAGVVLLFRGIVARPSPATTSAVTVSMAEQVLSQGRSLNVYRLDVDRIDLIRRAHGAAAAQAVTDALVEAATTRLPSGVFAVAPEGGHLTVVEAERRGAPSAAAGLGQEFEAAIARAGLADLAQVDVERTTVRTADELRVVLARVPAPAERPGGVRETVA